MQETWYTFLQMVSNKKWREPKKICGNEPAEAVKKETACNHWCRILMDDAKKKKFIYFQKSHEEANIFITFVSALKSSLTTCENFVFADLQGSHHFCSVVEVHRRILMTFSGLTYTKLGTAAKSSPIHFYVDGQIRLQWHWLKGLCKKTKQHATQSWCKVLYLLSEKK